MCGFIAQLEELSYEGQRKIILYRRRRRRRRGVGGDTTGLPDCFVLYYYPYYYYPYYYYPYYYDPYYYYPYYYYPYYYYQYYCQYSSRVLDIEHGTFTALIFTTTGGMGKECLNYHSRLAELIAIKKGEDYAKTISWIRARTSFALLRSALICLRGTRSTIRKSWDFRNTDIEIENIEGAIY